MSAQLQASSLTDGDVITDPGDPGRLCTVVHTLLDGDRVLVGTLSGAQHALPRRPVTVWNRYTTEGVEVNEVGILATRAGAQWWADFLLAHRGTGRIETVQATLGGSLCFVACDSTQEALWLAEHFRTHGVPGRCVKPITRVHRVDVSEWTPDPVGLIVDDEARSA